MPILAALFLRFYKFQSGKEEMHHIEILGMTSICVFQPRNISEVHVVKLVG